MTTVKCINLKDSTSYEITLDAHSFRTGLRQFNRTKRKSVKTTAAIKKKQSTDSVKVEKVKQQTIIETTKQEIKVQKDSIKANLKKQKSDNHVKIQKAKKLPRTMKWGAILIIGLLIGYFTLRKKVNL